MGKLIKVGERTIGYQSTPMLELLKAEEEADKNYAARAKAEAENVSSSGNSGESFTQKRLSVGWTPSTMFDRLQDNLIWHGAAAEAVRNQTGKERSNTTSEVKARLSEVNQGIARLSSQKNLNEEGMKALESAQAEAKELQKILKVYDEVDDRSGLDKAADIVEYLLQDKPREILDKGLDWGGAAVTSGLAQFTTGVANTADLLFGTPIKAAGNLVGQDWSNNIFSAGAREMNQLNEEYAQELMRQSGDNAALQIGGRVLSSAVAAAPAMIMAYLTGGASMASPETLAATAANEGSNVLQAVGNSVGQMMKDPNYWTSFIQEAGNNFYEAKEWTDSEDKAAIYALTVGLINAGVEIGLDGASGIQGLEQAVRQGETAGLKSFLKSAAGEAKEEVIQGLVSRGLGQLFGSGAPTLSTTDENAVINPYTMLEEGAMGAAVSMVLGGGQAVGQSIWNHVNAPMAGRGVVNTEETLPVSQNETSAETMSTTPQTTQDTQFNAALEAIDRLRNESPETQNAKAEPIGLEATLEALLGSDAPTQSNNIDNAGNMGYNTSVNGGVENAGTNAENTGTDQLYRATGEGIRAGSYGDGFGTVLEDRGQLGRGDLYNSGVVLLSPESQNTLTQRGIVNVELRESTTDSAAFSAALDEARNVDTRNGWAVSPKTPQELTEGNVRTFMDANGSTGFGIAADGDIEAVFANHEKGAPKGATKSLIPQAIAAGGEKLDCYGWKLANIYAQYGFEPIARVTFNPEYANPGWTQGMDTPDIYFMMHNGDSADTVVQNMGTYKAWTKAELDALPVMEYQEAYNYRDGLLAQRNQNDRNGNGNDGLGAANAGFTTPTRGEMVRTQNKTITDGVALSDADKAAYAPEFHERVTAQMSGERAATMFYQDENGNFVNLEDTVDTLLEKESWTGVEQDAAQIAFRALLQEVRNGNDEHIDTLRKLGRAIEEIGGTEAGRSLHARQKWIESGEGIVSKTATILEDPRIPENIAGEVLKTVTELAGQYDDAVVNEDIEALINIVREAAKHRETIGKSGDFSKVQNWALDLVRENGDIEFMQNAARSSIIAMAQDRVPKSRTEQLKAFRRDAMLSKVSTWLRNIVSNNVFDPIDSIGRDVSVPLDILLSKITGTRSVAADASWFSPAKREGAKYGLAKSILEVALDVSAEGAESAYGAAGNRTFKMSGGAVEQLFSRWEQLLNYAMYSTDQFQKGSIENSIQNGIDKLYERGLIADESLRDVGAREATYRTFQEDSKLSSMLLGIRRSLNELASIGDLGLGDVMMPFVQVPANLVDITVDYSPLGLVRGGAQLTQVLTAAHEGTLTAAQQARAVQTVGRSLTGAGLIALSALAKAAGILTISDDGKDEDKDKAALESQAGLTGTQLNISAFGRLFTGESTERRVGDKLMSLSFMDPMNALMTIGGLIIDDYSLEKGGDVDITLGEIFSDTGAGIVQSAMDLPMMSVVGDAYNAYTYSNADTEGGRWLDAAKQYAAGQVSSLIPNSIKGLAQGTDTKLRNLYTADNLLEQTLDSLLGGIPGLRQTLPVKQNSYGQDMEIGNRWLNFLNNNILPGAINEYAPPEADLTGWLDDLYEATGAVKQYPNKSAPSSISVDTDGDGTAEKLTLNADDKRQYQQTYGDIFSDLAGELMSGSKDTVLTLDELVDILSNIGSYANNQAKAEYYEAHDIEKDVSTNIVDKALAAKAEADIPFVTYMEYSAARSNVTYEQGVSGAKKEAVMAVIDALDLTKEQKDWLYLAEGYAEKTIGEAPWHGKG